MPLTPEIREKVRLELRKNSLEFQTVVDIDIASDARLIGALSAVTAGDLLVACMDANTERILREALNACPEVNEYTELSAIIADLGAHQAT